MRVIAPFRANHLSVPADDALAPKQLNRGFARGVRGRFVLCDRERDKGDEHRSEKGDVLHGRAIRSNETQDQRPRELEMMFACSQT